MNKRIGLELKIGIFVVLGIVAVVVFVFSQGKVARVKGYELKVVFGYVGGVEVGSPVRVSGVRVGEVKDIEISYDVKPRIELVLKLKPQVKIGPHSQITIRTLGIIGEKYVEITPSHEKETAAPGDTLRGVDPIELERFLSMGEDIVRNLNDVLAGVKRIVGEEDLQKNVRSILENTSVAMVKASEFMDRANNLSASLEKTNAEIRDVVVLTKPRIESVFEKIENFAGDSQQAVTVFTEKMEGLGDVGDEFKKVATEARRLITDLQTKGLIAQILREEKLMDEIKTEVSLLQETTRKINQGAENFTAVSSDLNRAMEHVTELSTELSDIASNVREGKGTVGKLLKSEELHDDMAQILKDVKVVVENIKKHGLLWRGTRK